MKLYTVCDLKEAEIKLKNESFGIRREEYSTEFYFELLRAVKDKYVHESFYWYETDMSDSDSGGHSADHTIDYTNIVVSNGALCGVIVRTSGYFPDFYLFDLKKGKLSLALGGGYNSLDYDFTLEDRVIPDGRVDVYAERMCVLEIVSRNEKGKVVSYRRHVGGFVPSFCKYEDGKNLLRAHGNFDSSFLLEDEGTYIQKEERPDDTNIVTETRTLVRVTPEFLEESIFPVTYPEFREGKYEVLGDRLERYV